MENSNSSLLGVITVTYNSESFIKEFLDCCVIQTYSKYRLLVIDNLSTDKTVDLIRNSRDDRLELIESDLNHGYALACNHGILHFRGLGISQILFINNDTVFGPNLFSDLVDSQRAFQADAVVPRITYASNPDLNWWAGGKISYWRGFQAKHLGEGKPTSQSDRKPRFCPVASGCCVLFSMAVFDAVGLFDPNYFVYWEDTDFFLRMQRLGKTLLYHPGITIGHKVSLSTGGPQSDFSIYYYQRNQIYLLRKHFDSSVLLSQVFILLCVFVLRLLVRLDFPRQFLLRIRAMNDGFAL